MARRELTRIQRLAGRVSWLDRHRRMLAIACAAVLSPILISHVAEVLGAGWPRLHATALCAMVGVMLWCVIEVMLVGLTALWETECDRLIRAGTLPRAELIVRRR